MVIHITTLMINLSPKVGDILYQRGGEKKKMKKLSVLVILVVIATVVSMTATASEADVTVTSVTVSPESVEVGENVTITATVENTGNTTETVPIVFKINGEEVKSVNVTVEANATETVECVVAADEAGTYNVTVDGASASFTVTAPPLSHVDTGSGTYPSIMGTHKGKVIPSYNIIVD